MSSATAPADSAPADELIQAITAAVRKFASESATASAAASAAAAASSAEKKQKPDSEIRKPYLEIQRYFRDDDEVELMSSRKEVKSTKKPASVCCDRQQCRCPFFGSDPAAPPFGPATTMDNAEEWERLNLFQQQQQEQPSALAAVFELVIMIGLLLWIFWLLGNVSIYM